MIPIWSGSAARNLMHSVSGILSTELARAPFQAKPTAVPVATIPLPLCLCKRPMAQKFTTKSFSVVAYYNWLYVL